MSWSCEKRYQALPTYTCSRSREPWEWGYEAVALWKHQIFRKIWRHSPPGKFRKGHLSGPTIWPVQLDYYIVRNCWRRKLSWIGEKYNFCRGNFHGLLAFAAPKDAMLPNFMEKTFVNSHKTAEFVKVSSLEASRYMVCRVSLGWWKLWCIYNL